MCGLHLRACRLRGRAHLCALQTDAVHVHDAGLALLDAQDVAGLVGEDDGLLVGQVEVVEDRVEGGPAVRLVVLCTAANPPDSAVLLLNIMVTRGADVRQCVQC